MRSKFSPMAIFQSFRKEYKFLLSFVFTFSDILSFWNLYVWIYGLCCKLHLFNWELSEMHCLLVQFIGLLPSPFFGFSIFSMFLWNELSGVILQVLHATESSTAKHLPILWALATMISTLNDSAYVHLDSLWLSILSTMGRFSKLYKKQGYVVHNKFEPRTIYFYLQHSCQHKSFPNSHPMWDFQSACFTQHWL